MIGPDLGRIEKAKEDRRIQLLKWVEYDRNYQNNFSNRVRKKASKRVEFGPNLVFLEAASRGDLKEVKKLIEDGINPDVANEDGLTALHQCCIDNNLEMCALLLENNANVNAKDNELWTPLHAAATCGNKELCGLLIDCGADLLALNIDGNMPYDLCDDDETLILVETEMAKRHVTQAQIDEIRLRPEKEMLNDLKRRHAAGDDLQSLDAQGAAPIHVAAACGYAEVARYLLQMRVDPQEPDADGWLPIHIAVSWGNLEIVEILVSYGADIEAPTKSGLTVYTICDSKEFRARLKEIWDRRDELRRAVRQNNLQQSFTRGMGSSRRRNNSSILRSSMRDKRRLTRAATERDKQVNSSESADAQQQQQQQQQSAAPAGRVENGAQASRVGAPTAAVAVNNNVRARNPAEVNGVSTPNGRKTSSSSSITGGGNNAAPNSSAAGAPAVPPRSARTGKRVASPHTDTPTVDTTTTATTSTTTTSSTSSTSSTATTSTTTSTSSSDSTSESSDAHANYVRPMQRTSNGQLVPVNSTDSVRSPPSQRSRTTPLTQDNRSRTPRRSDPFPPAAHPPKTPTSAAAAAASARDGLPPRGPSGVLREGPEHPNHPPRSANMTPSSSYLSNETLNRGIGASGRHKPFSCCHTM